MFTIIVSSPSAQMPSATTARRLADTAAQRKALDQFDTFWSGTDGYLAGNDDAFAKRDAGKLAES